MILELTTAPAVEPVSTAEAKSHLRVDVTDDDALIDRLVAGARQMVEATTGRALINQTWTMRLPGFPDIASDFIEIPRPPLSALTHIKYIDGDGVEQTWSTASYYVETPSGPFAQPARVFPVFGESWPTARAQQNAVELEFVAGYGTAGSNVPSGILSGLLLTVGDLYEHRQHVEGGAVTVIPDDALPVLQPFRVNQDFIA